MIEKINEKAFLEEIVDARKLASKLNEIITAVNDLTGRFDLLVQAKKMFKRDPDPVEELIRIIERGPLTLDRDVIPVEIPEIILEKAREHYQKLKEGDHESKTY